MPTILVVEDSVDLRETLAEILEEQGYTVRTAAHGQDAFDQLRTGPLPSLILLDLMMPVMDGWEFRRRQQEDARLRSIPVVVMSASADLSAVDAAGHLRKPFELSELLGTVADRCRKTAPGSPDTSSASGVERPSGPAWMPRRYPYGYLSMSPA